MNHANLFFFAQGMVRVLVYIIKFHFDDDMISVGVISQANGEFKLHTVVITAICIISTSHHLS